MGTARLSPEIESAMQAGDGPAAAGDRCPLCAGIDFARVEYGLLECSQCAIVLSPSIWRAGANEAFEEEWFGEDRPPPASVWVRRFEAWNNRRTLKRLGVPASSGYRLLEVGIGSGSFLRAARQHGFQVMGCDLSKAIASQVSRESGIDVHCGALSGMTEKGPFDVVVMNHVLEHVQDPVKFLREVSDLLSPDGIAHIAVPNVDCWEARLSGWTSYEPYHLLYFTPETLRSTVAKAGLRIDSASTHESFSGWFLALLRTLLGVNRDGRAIDPKGTSPRPRGRGHRPSVIEHAYRLAMAGAGAVTWPLRWLQGRAGRGDEIILIVRKAPDA